MILEVEAILREIGHSIIMPSFQRLAAGEIEEKSPGEWVTSVDRRAEDSLISRLGELAPDIVPIGEESVAANPGLLNDFYRGSFSRCWLIDPLDGTGNFIAGDERFAIMIALVEKNVTAASWMFEPARGRMAVCQREDGAYLDGRRVNVTEPSPGAPLHGSILDRFLPPRERELIDSNLDKIVRPPGSKCAAWDYVQIPTCRAIPGCWSFFAGGMDGRVENARYKYSRT